MKIIKTLFLLIILGLFSTLVYQNLDYFMKPAALHIDLKISTWNWTAPPLPLITYWGICFGLGLLITGMKGLITAFRLGREIKKQDVLVGTLKQEINDLKAKLNIFVHDPYIKKNMENESVEAIALEAPKAAKAEDVPKAQDADTEQTIVPPKEDELKKTGE